MREGRDTIRNGALFLNKYPKSPGSQNYHLHPNYNTRAFSLGKKLTSIEKSNHYVPGPGNYESL